MLSITGLNYISLRLNWDEWLLLSSISGHGSMGCQCCSLLKYLWLWKFSTVPWTPRVPASREYIQRIMELAVWSNYSSQCIRNYFYYDRKKFITRNIFMRLHFKLVWWWEVEKHTKPGPWSWGTWNYVKEADAEHHQWTLPINSTLPVNKTHKPDAWHRPEFARGIVLGSQSV